MAGDTIRTLRVPSATRGNNVPYLGQVTIVGPEPDPSRRQLLTDTSSAAIAHGRHRDRPERRVLEHRVIGHPGGAVITAVLDGEGLDFEEVATTFTSVGRHLTTQSPELREYTLRQIEVSKLEQRRGDDDWLPPLDHARADDPPAWPLPDLLGDPLQHLAAQYLVAGAVRSVWESGKQVDYPVFAARVAALGAADRFWQTEITTALGAMLIQAARLERAEDQDHAYLFVVEGASRTATDDLVRRARLTANDGETSGFTDDRTRGRLLMESFGETNQVNQADWTAGGEIPEVLEAGFGALATMCLAVRGVRSAWELAAELTDDPVVAAIAELESDRVHRGIAYDTAAVWATAASHAAVWAAIHQPDLLDTAVGGELLDDLTDNVNTVHHVVYSTLAILGAGTNAAALDDPRLSPSVKHPMRDFVRAQRLFQAHGYNGDALDDMHRALGTALEPGQEEPECLREVLRLITIAASLTATEVDPLTGQEGLVLTPSESSATLAVLALLAPEAAGAMAARLPILDDQDPRSEPAAREQALRWIHKAAESVGDPAAVTPSGPESPDARLLLALFRDDRSAPADWTVRRLMTAAAEAAASLIRPISLADADRVIAVFEGS